jgi:hypothetical protein
MRLLTNRNSLLKLAGALVLLDEVNKELKLAAEAANHKGR